MLKILPLSDLHNEYYRLDKRVTIPDIELEHDVDVIVLAGDIDNKLHGLTWAIRQSERLGLPILYVLGNHEYWQAKVPRQAEKLKEAAKGTDVQILDNDTVVMGGVRFIGSTLWTDYRLFGQDNLMLAMLEAENKMNDFRYIRNSLRANYPKIKAIDILRQYKQSIAYIEAEVARFFDGDTVVISHHAPSIESTAEHVRSELDTACYASALDEFIAQRDIQLWIHGHVHQYNDYRIGGTRIYANPRGGRDHEVQVNLSPILSSGEQTHLNVKLAK